MPKKTKKEKLLALYHKKIRLLENRQMAVSPVQEKVIIEDRTSVPVIENKIKTTINDPPQYFFSDLKKSLLLIVLILGLEVSLYFARLIK
ncbi:MAG: hypothetical protein WC741_01075 [Patescibacteria group bacterium]|jgi:hypothetical protein